MKCVWLIVLLFVASVSTLAVPVTVDPITVSSWRFPMTQVKVRVYANNTFLTSDNVLVQKGQIGGSRWYKEYNATVSGSSITIPEMVLDSTTDSDVPAASYTAVFFDSRGNKIDNYYAYFRVPSTYGTDVTWPIIRAYTESVSITLPSGYYPVATSDSRLEKDLSLYGNSLAAAVAALGVSETVLNCTRPVTVSASVTVPKNIKLRPTGECLITVAANQTLTIGAMEQVGSWRVFNSSASNARVAFSKGAVPKYNISWWVGSSATVAVDATDAINEAVASTVSNLGGTIYFPIGFYTTAGGHQIADGTIVEGEGNFVANGFGGSNIKLVSPTATYMWKIGQGEFGVRFRDLLLDGTGTTSRDGILLEGAFPNTSGDLQLERVTITAFANGLNYNSLSGSWQFAQMYAIQSIFQNNTVGIKANSVNSALTLVSTNFSVPAGGWALDIAAIGSTVLQNPEFACAGTGTNANIMRLTGSHGAIAFYGSQDESCDVFLQNDASDISGIVNIRDSLVQSKIQINQSMTLTSSGNNYLPDTIRLGVGAVPRIISTNDHVRTDTGTWELPAVIPASPLRLERSAAPIALIEQSATLGEFRQRYYQRFISPAYLDGAPTNPLVSIGHVTALAESKVLLRLGRLDANQVFDNYYDIARQNSGSAAGRLTITGNQTGFVGLDFNGDIFANGAVRSQACVLTDAATITVDPRCGGHFYVTLGGNRTFAMSVLDADGRTRADGQRLTIEIVQDGTGTRTCTLTTGSAGQFIFGTDIASIACTVTASKRDLLTAVYSSRLDRWMVTDFKKGF